MGLSPAPSTGAICPPTWPSKSGWTLNAWAHWLRADFGLPAAIVPPCWHLHPKLVWELSALRTAWFQAYDPQQSASGPLIWLAQFASARDRLRGWVQTAGCKLDRHRTTRCVTWPGEADRNEPTENRIHDREDVFVQYVLYDVKERERAAVGEAGDPGVVEPFEERSASAAP